MKTYKGVKGLKIKTTEEFIYHAKNVHGDKFDYRKSVFINMQEKLIIECSIHGEYNQPPYAHLRGHGCTYCGQHKHTQKSIITKLNELHPTLDFTEVIYKNISEKVPVTCKVCNHHFHPCIRNLIHKKSGCTKCGNSLKRTTEGFITECKNIYGDFYDYSPLIYTGIHDDVIIHCKRHNVDFRVEAANHLRYGTGCEHCKKDKGQSLGEAIIEKKLQSMNLYFIREKKFDDCKHINPLPFDFYLPDYNLCIEFDGLQHFKPIKHWGGKEQFLLQQLKDEIKNQYCKDNGINLIRISYKFQYKLNEKLIEELNKYIN